MSKKKLTRAQRDELRVAVGWFTAWPPFNATGSLLDTVSELFEATIEMEKPDGDENLYGHRFRAAAQLGCERLGW